MCMTMEYINEYYPKIMEFFTQDWIEKELEKDPNDYHPVINQIYRNRENSFIILEKFNRYLTVLEDEITRIGSYRRRLLHRGQYYNTIAELEIASMLKENGFQIELEPDVPNSQKKSDIKILDGENDIYIEIRTVKPKEGIPIKGKGEIVIEKIILHQAVDIADKIGDEVHGLSEENPGIVLLFLHPGFPNADILPLAFFRRRLTYHDGKVIFNTPGGNACDNTEISALFLYQQWYNQEGDHVTKQLIINPIANHCLSDGFIDKCRDIDIDVIIPDL